MDSLFLSRSPLARGFTLVEMLVVLTIITLVTTIALFGQSTFNRSLLLTDTAYSTALTIREMQSYGLSSRRTSTGLINAGYGAYFTAGTSYITFADTGGSSPASYCLLGTSGAPDAKAGNCRYDQASDVAIKTYQFERGFTISRVCAKDTSGTRRCSDDGSSPLSALHLVFLRPNTETVITGIRNSTGFEGISAEVYVKSGDSNDTRGICVSKVGQVSIATSTCP